MKIMRREGGIREDEGGGLEEHDVGSLFIIYFYHLLSNIYFLHYIFQTIFYK